MVVFDSQYGRSSSDASVPSVHPSAMRLAPRKSQSFRREVPRPQRAAVQRRREGEHTSPDSRRHAVAFSGAQLSRRANIGWMQTDATFVPFASSAHRRSSHQNRLATPTAASAT